ncbi:VWA domain-containing protein [Candidatus Gracilibacteria bacterium]|nr:VWA domain-containing protein [Candidatus Gracilibacteria bacterium]
MIKYFDIDQSNTISRARAYFRFRGKDIQIKREGDRSVLKIEKSLISAINFIFNQFERKPKNIQIDSENDNNTNPIAPEDQDEYVPKVMEDQEDSNRPPSFWQIDPPLPGYYYSGRKSYYNIPSKLWSKKKIFSSYQPVSIDMIEKKYVLTGKVVRGVFALPLPVNSLIDPKSIHPSSPQVKIEQDQKGCFYIISTASYEIQFDFYTNQIVHEKPFISADSEKIVTGTLTENTMKLLESLKSSSKSIQEKAGEVCDHIALIKKYSVEYQFYIYHTSTSQDYFYNLDASPVLECYSANTLYVGLMREIGIPARLCSGHNLDTKNEYGGKSHISNQTGHAWSEIWDGGSWVLMDATPKQKDKNIIEDLKEEIERTEEERKSEISDMGFDPGSEQGLYSQYKALEDEVKPMITKNIRDLENILPREYHLEEQGYFRSGKLDKRKLVQWKVTGDSQIFTRNHQVDLDPELLLFEGIAIDNSGSMGDVGTPGSPLREAVKSAIIRARTLEHFDVQFSILVFNTEVHEVMKFGEKYTSKKNTIPSRLMRAVKSPGGTDMGKPLELMESHISEFEAQGGKGRYGNITFIGDGEPSHGKTGKDLKKLIGRIGSRFPITAYYISGGSQNSGALGGYFSPENVEVIPDVSELSSAMMRTFNTKLRKKLHQITSYNS